MEIQDEGLHGDGSVLRAVTGQLATKHFALQTQCRHQWLNSDISLSELHGECFPAVSGTTAVSKSADTLSSDKSSYTQASFPRRLNLPLLGCSFSMAKYHRDCDHTCGRFTPSQNSRAMGGFRYNRKSRSLGKGHSVARTIKLPVAAQFVFTFTFQKKKKKKNPVTTKSGNLNKRKVVHFPPRFRAGRQSEITFNC